MNWFQPKVRKLTQQRNHSRRETLCIWVYGSWIYLDEICDTSTGGLRFVQWSWISPGLPPRFSLASNCVTWLARKLTRIPFALSYEIILICVIIHVLWEYAKASPFDKMKMYRKHHSTREWSIWTHVCANILLWWLLSVTSATYTRSVQQTGYFITVQRNMFACKWECWSSRVGNHSDDLEFGHVVYLLCIKRREQLLLIILLSMLYRKRDEHTHSLFC